jgi:hypothetical protein
MFVSSSAFALNNFYIDGFGSLVTTNDAKTQFGGGLGIGYNIIDSWNLVYKFQMDLYSETYHNTSKTMDYKYMSNLIGVEYVWKFGRIGWRSSILAGMSSVTIPYVGNDFGSPTIYTNHELDKDDYSGGIVMAINTGAQFDLTQHVAPFLDLGFHYDIYSKEKKDYNYNSLMNTSPIKLYGINVLVGVRITIGSNSSIGADY